MLGTINGLQPQKRANTFFLICSPGLPNSRKNSKLFLGIPPCRRFDSAPSHLFAFAACSFMPRQMKALLWPAFRRLRGLSVNYRNYKSGTRSASFLNEIVIYEEFSDEARET